MSFFEKIKAGLKKTLGSVAFAFSGRKLDDEFFLDLEEQLILADAGAAVAAEIVLKLRRRVQENMITDAEEAKLLLVEIVAGMLSAETELDFSGRPAVLLLVGVNGAGKTTTAGKLANIFKAGGFEVLLAAADTFRAAAVEQLEVWASRSGVRMISGAGDPSAVIYDAVSLAASRDRTLVICDTAGRLHTKKNLMDELAKMTRSVKKAAPDSSMEVLLVIDAVTGQNAINQAAQFAADAGVSGIVLTKLDGTAKGGSVLAIKSQLGIPVRYVGVGEAVDDLMVFDPEAFSRALFN